MSRAWATGCMQRADPTCCQIRWPCCAALRPHKTPHAAYWMISCTPQGEVASFYPFLSSWADKLRSWSARPVCCRQTHVATAGGPQLHIDSCSVMHCGCCRSTAGGGAEQLGLELGLLSSHKDVAPGVTLMMSRAGPQQLGLSGCLDTHNLPCTSPDGELHVAGRGQVLPSAAAAQPQRQPRGRAGPGTGKVLSPTSAAWRPRWPGAGTGEVLSPTSAAGRPGRPGAG